MYVMFSMMCWGLWGIFQKVATEILGPYRTLVTQLLGNLVVILPLSLWLAFKGRLFEVKGLGLMYAILGGVAGSLGMIAFLKALDIGSVSLTVMVTGLYPVITLILAWSFLGESVSARQVLGIIAALVAIILLSS